MELTNGRTLFEEDLPVLRGPTINARSKHRQDAGFILGQQIEDGCRRGRRCLKQQIVAVDLDLNTRGTCLSESLRCTHSRPFQAESELFLLPPFSVWEGVSP
jgi:hypothetical protein